MHVEPTTQVPLTAEPVPPRAARALQVAGLVVVLVTLIGLVLLWPRGPGPTPTAAEGGEGLGLVSERLDVTVERVFGEQVCAEFETPPCTSASVRVDEGPEAGRTMVLGSEAGLTNLDIEPGDGLVLSVSEGFDGTPGYQVIDRQRGVPLLVLFGLFAVAVIALGRLRGLAALAGLAVSLALLLVFLIPGVLRGNDPLAMAVVGGTAVLIVVLYLAHGVSLRSTTALLGTVISLGLTALLAQVFVTAANLSGFSSDEAVFVRAVFGEIDLRGLLLAGIVIGALGVLDDVTVTQVSTVWEIRRADPTLPRRQLVSAGLRVGRDHVAATVNTLLLAYIGTSLPLVLVYYANSTGLVDGITSETIAQEVVRTFAGSIGLVAAVPVTTVIAAWVAAPPSATGARADLQESRVRRRRRPTPPPDPWDW